MIEMLHFSYQRSAHLITLNLIVESIFPGSGTRDKNTCIADRGAFLWQIFIFV